MFKKIAAFSIGIAVLALSMPVSAQNSVTGNKDYKTKTINVDNFTEINLNGSPEVFYTQTSAKPSVEIYASSNIIPLIETYVKNGTLIVQYKKNTNIRNSGKVEIRVSGPALSEIRVNGSGDIHIKNGMDTRNDINVIVNGSGDIDGKNIRCNNLTVNVRGSGDIRLSNVKSKYSEVKVHGSGDIYLNGESESAEYNVHGSGDINAVDLKAENVSAYVHGSGDIKCHAIRTLSGRINGSGDVGYKGNPEIDFSKKGLHRL